MLQHLFTLLKFFAEKKRQRRYFQSNSFPTATKIYYLFRGNDFPFSKIKIIFIFCLYFPFNYITANG